VSINGNLDLCCYVDADFAGLHRSDPPLSSSSAKSRTGYLITLGSFPILWKSQLQSEITLSTLEAEYSALSSALRVLIPVKNTLAELIINIQSTSSAPPLIICCRVFEDNNGALLLANKQQLTTRTKYFHVKWHFFWDKVTAGEITIEKIATDLQQADYLTKGLPRVPFERI